MSSDDKKKVAIVGSGLIGRSWASLFVGVGYKVHLHDVDSNNLSKAKEFLARELETLANMRPSTLGLSVEQQLDLVSTTSSLAECIKDAVHIQECVFDDLVLKQKLFKEIDSLLGEDNKQTAVCSSTSIHMPSLVFAQVTIHKDQCLVAHPINPPTLVPLVELITTPVTKEDIFAAVKQTMIDLGQKPVRLNKEISGFALNRLQYPVIQAAYKLVHDGVMSPEDVDTVVSHGLGLRYAFMGPFMTGHLNANGLQDYFDKYGEGIHKVTLDQNLPLLKYEGDVLKKCVDATNNEVPLEKLAEKRAWRDKCLSDLAMLKKKLGD